MTSQGKTLSSRTWDWDNTKQMRSILKVLYNGKRVSGKPLDRIIKCLDESLLCSEIATFDPQYEFDGNINSMREKLLHCVMYENERKKRESRRVTALRENVHSLEADAKEVMKTITDHNGK